MHSYRWVFLVVLVTLAMLMLSQRDENRSPRAGNYLDRLAHFEDSTGELSATDVVGLIPAFSEVSDATLNFGLSSSTHWVWVSVTRATTEAVSLRLELGYPHLDELDVYRLIDGVPKLQYELGDALPFHTRPVRDRTFVLPIEFSSSSHSADLLFRTRSQGSIQLPFTIKSESDYQLKDRNEQLLLGFYYGILLGVLAYNLLLAFGTREPVYAYYCAYAMCLLLFQFSQNGLAFEYLWPHWSGWHQLSIPLFASMALFFCSRFTRLFLNINAQTSPRFNRAFRVIEVVFASLAVATLFADRTLVISLVSISVSLAGVFMMAAAIIIYAQGNNNARYYLLAWSVLLFGVVVYATKTLGMLPETFITEYSVQIGSAIEMILLSYALADRFNRLRQENVRIHALANATLEVRVEQRTRELNATLQQLEKANTQLQSMSQRDPLTGIYNRRYFNEEMDRVCSGPTYRHAPIALMMIDIDHFKSVNDERGHLIGDEVIRHIAEVISNLVPGSEPIAARFGGEEFVVLTPGYDAAAVDCLAEQVRAAVEECRFATSTGVPLIGDVDTTCSVQKSFGVTVSIGFSVSAVGHQALHGGLELIEQADQALYVAKASGRNRCRAFGDIPTGEPPSLAA